MQESLLNTVQKLAQEEKINVEELEIILDSNIEDVVKLCKKACLKPKTDANGNAFFTRNDVDTLKKMKALYSKTQEIQKNMHEEESLKTSTEKLMQEEQDITNPNKKINFLMRAKNRIKQENSLPVAINNTSYQIQKGMENLENNLISKMSDLLSEKMDGFDEIIVELIRAKTENENLRQQVNSLNKQVFILKNELASFNALAFGLYTKKETEEL